MPVPSTALHIYVVPATVLVIAILGALPLQTEVSTGSTATTGIGFTVTTAVAEAVHVLAEPVMV
jgi:hypothetical protein